MFLNYVHFLLLGYMLLNNFHKSSKFVVRIWVHIKHYVSQYIPLDKNQIN